jgi:hypothetical protein
VRVSGSANVNLGCGVVANSNGGQAIHLSGSGRLIATSLSAVGQIDLKDTSVPAGTDLFPNYVPQTDPFGPKGRNLSAPTSPATCTQTGYANSPSSVETLYPGRYCNGIDLKGENNFRERRVHRRWRNPEPFGSVGLDRSGCHIRFG